MSFVLYTINVDYMFDANYVKVQTIQKIKNKLHLEKRMLSMLSQLKQ